MKNTRDITYDKMRLAQSKKGLGYFTTWSAATYSLLLAIILIFTANVSYSADVVQDENSVLRAEFTQSGEIKIPQNWRAWVFIGANLTPNALNGGKALFPEFHYTYIEPSAWSYFKRTGEFADGTQIVKELYLIAEGSGIDASNGSSMTASGRGFPPGKPLTLALEYKDRKRFPNNPGGWSFYDFSSGKSTYKSSAEAHPYENCAGCHELAKDTDYVFMDSYPVLLERKSSYAPLIKK